MRVLVCGGRDYFDKQTVFYTLDELHAKEPISLLIHGACPVGHGGADMLAEQWAKDREISYLGDPAKFQKQGRSAGPIRNQKMIDAWRPDLVVSFPGGSGTADMVKKALAAGITTQRVG